MNYQLINVYGTQDEERLEVFVITNICNVHCAPNSLFTITNIQLLNFALIYSEMRFAILGIDSNITS